MDLWVIWLIACVVLAVGEIVTTGFFLAPFALGALVATVLDLAGVPDAASVVAFILVSVASLTLVRPIARRHMTMPAISRTGTDALIGQPAIVVDSIANDVPKGSVRIGGEVWTARAYDDDDTYEAGQKVQVIEIRGATALVHEL